MNTHTTYLKKSLLKTLVLVFMMTFMQAYSAPIQRTITIDNDPTDWKVPTNITTNPGQFSTDNEGDASTGSNADLDYPVQATGRDLKRFSYTYDNTNLYMWVERYTSISNRTDWWFYIDIDNDGLLETGEKVLNVLWTGSNGSTKLKLSDYVPSRAVGDPLICPTTGTNSVADNWCPVAGTADGYDMPGTLHWQYYDLGSYQNQSGGSTSGTTAGVEMETMISWALLGLSGPTSIQFHISSSNGTNIPKQINDNMEGPNGGGLAFSDLSVVKTASTATSYSGNTFTYQMVVTNNGDSNATNVSLDDFLPADVSYVSHTTTNGNYDQTTGKWTIGDLTISNNATLTITVKSNQVTGDTITTNTANNLTADQADPNTANNTSSVDVIIKPAPEISLQKTSKTITDPINGTNNPKAIPGATSEYSITATNTGITAADNNTIILTDAIPANTAFYVGDISGPGTGPVRFIDGSPSSGLSYNFINLASTSDNVSFSNNNGSSYVYVPSPDADGVDTSVTNIRVSTSGQFLATSASGDPSFSILFRVKVQ